MAYGIDPQVLRLIQRYWYHLLMVAREVEYYGSPFKGQRGVTQGDPLYPTISNMVVDAVLQNWV